MAILAPSADREGVVLTATSATRALLIAGKPLSEPIALMRPVRDEYAGRDPPGGAGLPVRSFRCLDSLPGIVV
jgi:hypothetical protein